MEEVTKFVLLTTQRSGSTFIRLWLNSHPNVRCHSEVFLRTYPAADGFKHFCEKNNMTRLLYYSIGAHWFGKSSYNFVMKWMIDRYLAELFNNPEFSAPWIDMTTDSWKEYQPRTEATPHKVVGYQLMYDQLAHYRVLYDWITNENATIIHLIRKNSLKLLLSRIVSKKTKQYHFARNDSKRKVFLDPETVLDQLDRIVKKRAKMQKRFPNNPYIEITYEGFFSNYSKESTRLLSFLNLKRVKMRVPEFLKKLNPDSLEDLIENYQEIVRLLQGTAYQGLLN